MPLGTVFFIRPSGKLQLNPHSSHAAELFKLRSGTDSDRYAEMWCSVSTSLHADGVDYARDG